ncbi:MAG: hypothetical protein Q7O66_09850 [Dehalococcoidia bacterium]|nr:hypothetical protein [Dehalococcoidia bacterium]
MNSLLARSRVVLIVIIGAVALVTLSGCGLGSTTTPEKTADALPVSALIQKAQVGEIELTATWLNPSRSTTEPVRFKIQMDIHSGSLDDYDLAGVSTLANDSGQQVKASRWDPPGGGHHGFGPLYFPATDSTGKPVINADAKYVEWVISDLAGVTEKKTIRWEITQ